MVAVSCEVVPFSRFRVVGFSVTPVTAMLGVNTVMAQVAFFPPSAVVAVMVVAPLARAVTSPLALTVAMATLLDE